MSSDAATRRVFGLEWPAQVTTAERRSLIAGGLGWMLDAMDVMLYAFALTAIRAEFGLDGAQAGLLASVTLIASAVGGIGAGILADRFGRARILVLSILAYALFTGATAIVREAPPVSAPISAKPAPSCESISMIVSGGCACARRTSCASAASSPAGRARWET